VEGEESVEERVDERVEGKESVEEERVEGGTYGAPGPLGQAGRGASPVNKGMRHAMEGGGATLRMLKMSV
jgi:hypothetical protein